MNMYLRTLRLWRFCCIVLLAAFSNVASPSELTDRQVAARAMWQERCKRSGEFIHKTISGVSGVFLIKVRPQARNFDNQFGLTDPYGDDHGGDAYVQSFLRGSYRFNVSDVPEGGPPRRGYQYIETEDVLDGKRYRYTGAIKAVRKKDSKAPGIQRELRRDPNYDLNIYAFVLNKEPATTEPPRYGVTYQDISTPEERQYWIAGSSLKVIDLKTGEVIAERIGYMVDLQQGNRSGGRSPWFFAADNACPHFTRNFKNAKIGTGPAAPSQTYQTLDFVEKVLKPSS